MIAAVVGYAIDRFDLLIFGFMLDPISRDLGLDRTRAAALVTWTLLGAVCGDVLSDRYGRVRVLSWSILSSRCSPGFAPSRATAMSSSSTARLPALGWAANSGSA